MPAPNYARLTVKRICEEKLGITFRKGSKEQSGWFLLRGRKAARITVPKGRKPIGKGLFGAMATQLKLTSDQFKSLLDCPLTRQEYEEILENQNPQ
jgi:hypothetical protein